VTKYPSFLYGKEENDVGGQNPKKPRDKKPGSTLAQNETLKQELCFFFVELRKSGQKC
jgi:hypothetical protein